MTVEIIKHNSPEYHQSVELRYRILREPLGLTYTQEQLDTESTDIHVAAISDGKVIGIIILSPQKEGKLKMRQFAVDSNRQGQGTGKAIVRFAEKWALENNFNEIVLHARETAVPFYLNLGYAKSGNRFEEVSLPHWYMSKNL